MVGNQTMLVPLCLSFCCLSIPSFPFCFGEKEGLKLGGIYSFILDEYLLSAYIVPGTGTTAQKVMIPTLLVLQRVFRTWNQTELGSSPGSTTYKLWFLGQVPSQKKRPRGYALGPQASRTRPVKP